MSQTRVDFYQLSRDPVDVTVAKLARKVLQAGERLLVVSGDEMQRAHLSQVLWQQGGGAFLANGMAGGAYEARQPILLSDVCSAPNEARMALIADGQWRDEALGFDRVLLLFDADQRDAAADLWRRFARDEAVDNRIHKQDGNGAWREGG
ncbi:DNA polymerase III subunit chi [Qipengyuania qiaonensis]|uniref:DNA polymerase III subunit chi n=1 Tax=Qipengyuania qiaonensis TaxID=2867240 RepID=A0ABS7J577_9SPHN|nr:DNA polymerase III subunit chi [Qipengyuania qiaonensis]MBX7482495.1 DNA polymerase III subunit chi [Qipengyuania qiaonensis]